MNNNFKKLLEIIIVIFFAMLLILYPQKTASGATKGIELCLNILIPSLFPFLVFTCFLSITKIGEKLFYYPSKVLSKILKVDILSCTIFFLSIIGGYPSAAKTISIYTKNKVITTKKAEKLLCSCTNAGPAFLISAIGLKMFLSSDIGLILYLSSVLSSLTLFCFYKYKSIDKKNCINNSINLSDSIIKSVKESTISITSICSFVIIFSSFFSHLSNITNLDFLNAFLQGIFEVTSGVSIAANKDNFVNIILVSVLTGFGGLCIYFQIKSICSDASISTKKFLVSRLFSALLNGLFTSVLLLIIPIKSTETFVNNSDKAIYSVLNTPLPAIMLLLCCICFPLCLKNIKKI